MVPPPLRFFPCPAVPQGIKKNLTLARSSVMYTYNTVFDISPGYWEMDNYGTAVLVTYCYGSVYFYEFQPWFEYHC